MIKTTVLDELPYWLVLNRCSKVGPKRLKDLQTHGKGMSPWFKGTTPTSELKEWYQSFSDQPLVLDWAGAEKDLAWKEQDGCHILLDNTSNYPNYLKQTVGYPPVLFVKGEVKALSSLQIAMVGSRRPSIFGKRNAFYFAKSLSEYGFTITSGLALGIDGVSHQAAVESSGPTVAVLAHGLDQVYPKSHKSLSRQILAHNGALLSEMPIGVTPRPEYFPRRNRIISGLSVAVIIIEAAKKSGSLITANYALDQGREIFALPSNIDNPQAKGCHELIRQGAVCIDSPKQILRVLAPQLTEWQSNASMNNNDKISHKPNLSTEQPIKEEIHSQLSPSEAKILDLVMGTCTPLDKIVDQSGLTPQEISIMLLNLELQGCIKTVPGGVIRNLTGDHYERECD